MTEDQIKHMVNRFLGWRLPANFRPDAGISFKPTFNDHMPHPMRHEPTGTNLFDASQATAMVRHMLEGIPQEAPRFDRSKCDCFAEDGDAHQAYCAAVREFDAAIPAHIADLRSKLSASEAARDALKADLKFIADITAEELAYAKVGTGAEVALRHANRRAGQGMNR